MQKENTGTEEQPQEELPEVQQELSKVAANPKQSMLILAGICLVVGYIFYNLFFTSGPSSKDAIPVTPTEVSKPAEAVSSNIPAIPQLPEPPKLTEPTAPPPPSDLSTNSFEANLPPPPPSIPSETKPPVPGVPIVSAPTSTEFSESDEAKKRREAKRKASIILIAGAAEKKSPDQIAQEADFKVRGNMELVLGKGKIIDAVLESALNTDYIAEVRALVSRDVFSETGRVVLIPKGSRMFGTFAVSTGNNDGRIVIEWNRIDLASGYTVNLIGSGVDALGRKGTAGRVDNKYKERFSNAIMTSAFNIAFAQALDKVIAPPATAQAATNNQATATQINSIAATVSADATQSENARRVSICTQVQGAITDKTSTAFTTFVAACNSPATGTPAQQLATIVSAANAASAALLTSAASQVTPTQAQNASKQAFTDVTNTVKDIASQQQFKPTTTIDQGTPVKIYVTKDYKFPKAAVTKSRMLQ